MEKTKKSQSVKTFAKKQCIARRTTMTSVSEAKSQDSAKTNDVTRRLTLKPGSKWRVAQKMIGLMDSNRASNEKQDFADIVKMFQRLNAQKIFDNLNAAEQLTDINSGGVHSAASAERFEGLDATRARLADTRYDSVEIEHDFSAELNRHQKSSKGQCRRGQIIATQRYQFRLICQTSNAI